MKLPVTWMPQVHSGFTVGTSMASTCTAGVSALNTPVSRTGSGKCILISPGGWEGGLIAHLLAGGVEQERCLRSSK